MGSSSSKNMRGGARMPASCAASNSTAAAPPPMPAAATPAAGQQRRHSKAATSSEAAAAGGGGAGRGAREAGATSAAGQAPATAAAAEAPAAGEASSLWPRVDDERWMEERGGDSGGIENELRMKKRGAGEGSNLVLREKPQQQQHRQEQAQAQQQQQDEGEAGAAAKPVKLRVCSHSSDTGPVAAGTTVIRPFLRGKIHLLLLFLSPLWIFLLLSACSSTRALVAAAISCLSFAFNFFASALLHCFEWADRPALQQLLHKLDHAGIFFVISGSTSPIPVLLLDASSSFWLLLVQFVATCYGFISIIFGNLSSAARKRRAYTYIIVGLLHALFLSEYYRVLTHTELLAIFTLSTLYVLGALVYGFKWPDPFPAVYGFHEVFHSFCLLSFLVTVWLDYVVIQRAEWSGPVAAAVKEATSLPSSGEAPGLGGGAQVKGEL